MAKRRHLYLFLILLFLINTTEQALTIHTIIVDSININVVTNYLWQITFDSNINRNDINLNFPTALTLSNSTNAAIGGVSLITSVNGNVLTITNSTLLLGTVNINVGNVQNPNSAISSSAFSATTATDGTTSMSSTSFIQYQQGFLSSSSWSFSSCT